MRPIYFLEIIPGNSTLSREDLLYVVLSRVKLTQLLVNSE